MEKSQLSARLVYQRQKQGLSQEQLAEKTNVTVRTIQRIEKAEVTPQPRTIKLLAAALDVDIEELITLEAPQADSLQIKWLLLIHATPVLGFVLPFFNILCPLFLWIHKREDNKLYDQHGRAVIDFHITMTLLFVAGLIALLSAEKLGFYFFISVIPFTVLVMLLNIVSVIKNQKCFYPLAIPLLKNTKRNTLNIGVIFIVLSAALNTNPTLAGEKEPRNSDDLVHFEKFIVELKKEKQIPGISVAISEGGELVYSKAFGFSHVSGRVPLQTDTPFWIASISKFFVGTTFLSLVEQGELKLDDKLNATQDFDSYCRWLANSQIIFGKNLKCDQTFQLKHALNHVVNGTVDTEFSYNSIFYSRLSRFLETKRGNDISLAKGRHNELAKAITSAIIEPAGMTNSIAGLWDENRSNVYFKRTRGYGVEDGYYVARPEPQRHMAGGAGISATAEDIIKFDNALDNDLILSPEYRELTETSYITDSGTPIPYAYGRYVQYINDEKILWHSGWDEDAGYSAIYLKFPERELTVVVLANSEGLWWGSPLDKAAIEKSPIFQKVSTLFSH